MTTRVDYQAIATVAVDLLCTIGFLGLDPSKQRQLWQEALDLDRKLHPDRPPIIVWTEEEGDVDPPRKPGSQRDNRDQPSRRSEPVTLQEILTTSSHYTRRDIAGGDGYEGTFFDQGIGTSIRVSLWSDGRARISQFDSQMSAEWTADFSAGVDDALTVAFLGAAERCMAPVPAETTDHHHQGEQDR